MTAPECSIYQCDKRGEFVVGCATSERLNETWTACVDHVPKVIRYLKERDSGWQIDESCIAVAEIAHKDHLARE